ncbi:hypothetical protein MCEREM21A_02359 [Sphingomonadaceae bacterium]
MVQIIVAVLMGAIRPTAVSFLALIATVSEPALAVSQSEFCAGFEEGFRSVKGSLVIVPICPIAPITPIGSSPFREGIKAGIAAALKR